jgi:hypothetical protein
VQLAATAQKREEFVAGVEKIDTGELAIRFQSSKPILLDAKNREFGGDKLDSRETRISARPLLSKRWPLTVRSWNSVRRCL